MSPEARRDNAGPHPSLDDAISLQERGRWREAERIYQALLNAGNDRYAVLVQLGLLRAQLGQSDAAIELLQQAIGEEPDDPDAHMQLGAVLLAANRAEEAVVACDRALALDPDDPQAHYNRGAALYALDRPADALAAYERAIAIERRFPAAHYNLGVALRALGRLEDAATAFAEAVSVKPDYVQAYIALAGAHLLLGRHEAAIASFDAALAIEPANSGALLGLAGALLKVSRHEEAVGWFERTIGAAPGDPQAYSGLAGCLAALGRHAEAAAAFETALEIEPSNIALLLGLAASQAKLSRHDQAIATYRKAIATARDNPQAYLGLGDVLRAQGRNAEAIAHYERALLLAPKNAEALNNLGIALAAVGRPEEAVTQYREAIALLPDLALLHNNLGTALEALGETEAALASYERALSLNPELSEARLGFATVLGHLGRFADARPIFEGMLASGTTSTKIRAFYGLGVSNRFAADDPHLAAAEAFAGEPASLSQEDRMHLHFGLAKAYDDLGQRERSFGQLVEGNRLKRDQITYAEAEVLGFMRRCRGFFTDEFFREHAGQGDSSQVPVFIVGMMRSGSTLVEQILASHPSVFGGGERPFLEKALIATLNDAGVRYAPDYMDRIGSLDAGWIGRLAERYLQALTAAAPPARRITDKLLGNFAHIGLIHLALPNARIIHTRRDALDTCLSCFSKLFAAPIPYTYDLAELGRYYRTYERLMDHWRRVLPDGLMLEVQYEDVINDLSGAARRIVEHCGLEWDEACLAFYRTERPVRTASVAQVRQPIYRRAVGRARGLERQLRPLIDALSGRVPDAPAA